MKEYPFTFKSYTTAFTLQRVCFLLWLEKLWVIAKVQLLTESEVDSVLTCSEVRNFLIQLHINSIEEIINQYEINGTSETLDKLLDTFDGLFKKIDLLLKENNTLASLYNHDIRNTIQYLYPASQKEWRSFIVESLWSEELKNLTTAWKKFIAFLESLYFVFQIPKEVLTQRKKDKSLHGILEIARYQVKLSITILFKEEIASFWIGWDFTILLANIFRNSEKHWQAKHIEISLEKGNTLIIKDDWVWISPEVISSMFQSWISGTWSTWLWLRNLKERGFEIKASNDWLPNKNWWYGAKIEVKFQNKKPS
jgi:signal transduction histidine kinase